MVKRPFAFVGGIILLSFLIFAEPLLWGISSLGFAVVFFLVRKKALKRAALLGLAVFVAAGSILMLRSELANSRAARFDGKTAYIEGYVCELPEMGEEETRLTVKIGAVTLHSEPIEVNFKGELRLSEEIEVNEYDRVGFYAKMSAIDFAERNGRISFSLKALSEPEVIGRQKSDIYHSVLRLKKAILSKLSSDSADEASGLLSALLIGDKTEISDETKDAFRRSGVSHITVVSGVHLVTVTLFVYEILKKLLRRSPTVIALIVVWIMAALTAFSPSAVRAAVMMSVILAGNLFGREADSLNSLGLAVAAITLVSPGTARDVGFLLSVSATLGLILFSNRISLALRKLMRVNYKTPQPLRSVLYGFAELVAQSVAAWVATLPVTVLFFGRVSVVAPLANIFVGSVASATLVITVMGVALPFVGIPVIRLAKAGAVLLIWATKALASLPFAYIEISAETLIPLATAVFLAIFYCKKCGRHRLAALSLAFTVFFAGRIGEGVRNAGTCRVDSLYIPRGTAACITCGGNRVLYLSGISVESVPSVLRGLSYLGIRKVSSVAVGDAYSLLAAESIAAETECDSLTLPYAAGGSARASASLGRATLTAVSEGSCLNLFVTCGNNVFAFTEGELIKGDYDAVFSAKTPLTDKILVTDLPSDYVELSASKVFYTLDGTVSLVSDGERVYEI